MAGFFVEVRGTRVALTPGVWRIGRDGECEIRLDDEAISRRHATLRVLVDRLTLLDHGSRNGVRVNGERIHGEVEVRPGDVLTIGPETLTLGARDHGLESGAPAPTRPLPKVSALDDDSPLDQLSPREREVFERLAHGETQREVAEKLGLSVKTVETYRARIGDKLGLGSRADLVELALQTGVLRPR
jgi:DNA-binding CsgD family transcriptional regulator